MSEGKFYGETKKVDPEKETLAEVVKKAEEIDEKNKKRGGDGTVVIENDPEKEQIRLTTEEVPTPEETR